MSDFGDLFGDLFSEKDKTTAEALDALLRPKKDCGIKFAHEFPKGAALGKLTFCTYCSAPVYPTQVAKR